MQLSLLRPADANTIPMNGVGPADGEYGGKAAGEQYFTRVECVRILDHVSRSHVREQNVHVVSAVVDAFADSRFFGELCDACGGKRVDRLAFAHDADEMEIDGLEA